MSKTASQRAAEINATDRERAKAEGYTLWGTLVEDKEHWDSCGIHTAEELDHYLAQSTHWDLYKEIHGFRPRWINYSVMTTEEIETEIEALYEHERVREAEEARVVAIYEDTRKELEPLTHNPFAGLKL